MTKDILYILTSSQTRTRLLEYFISSEDEIQFSELQRKLGLNPRQLTLQLQRLKQIDMVIERVLGKKKFYRANRAARYFNALRDLINSLKAEEGWFRWERAATIHHLYMALQAAMAPMREYFGMCWPLTLMIYKGENVLWCNRIKDLSVLGEKIIAWYQHTGQQKYERDIEKRTHALKDMFQSIRSAKLSRLSVRQLDKIYQSLWRAYTHWYALLWTTEPVAIRVEEVLKQELAHISAREFAMLTSTTRTSFTQEIEDAMQKIVNAVRSVDGNVHHARIVRMIGEFQQNYYWMHNNYFATSVLEQEHVILEVKKRLALPERRARDIRVTNAQKHSLMKKLKLDTETRTLIDIGDLFTYLQDVRKKWIMMTAHYLELLLKEAGKRSGLSLHEMRYTLPEEFPSILRRHHPHIHERIKNCMIVFEEGVERGTLLVGEMASREERNYFPSGNSVPLSPARVVLKGRVACHGKAIGTVKVLMNPNEIYKVNHGDVLVTSMTSPDFITAVRKCVAIVTNEGGLTCHAAIISRELNIPCIIGTKNATQALKDGDKVEVNADEGMVAVLA